MELKTARQVEQKFAKTITKELKTQYLLYLPAGYGKTDKKWPLIMFLHGAGERGRNPANLKRHGIPKIVEEQKDFPFITISPQCPSGQWWPNNIEILINLLDEIIATYDVDPDRVYLTGMSMGGYGTWYLACSYPDRFAAIAPVCGGGHPAVKAANLKGMPIWVFHGSDDGIVPLSESQEMVNAAKSGGAKVKFTIYPGVGHDAWTQTYDNPQLYEWFLEHRRKKR